MPAAFRVLTTRAFDRSIRRLARKNRDIPAVFQELVSVLSTDPVSPAPDQEAHRRGAGNGQWRIRSGVYRLRYDVDGSDVIPHSVNHRSAAY